ncbi:MAG TPA: FAD-binding oxidoreductase [Candidatus Limnocylindrales bacterium]
MTLTAHALEGPIRQLKQTIAGRVIEPGSEDYDSARKVMMGNIDRHPAAIVRVANVDDVKAVVALAGATGVELAIRSGGHSAKGDSTTEGGIVLDLRDLRKIDIDPVARTAWAETGLTANEVTKAAAEHGLAIGFGDTGSVGIGGITTGGGIGYLVRKYGLTIDNLLAADVVTADGELRRADQITNPDLFWAIRGGGGNFGVVTRFQYRLVDLPEIVGGMLFLPATAETVERFVTLAEEAPEEMSTIANVMPCPPMPMVDKAWHGKLVIFGLMCFAGGAEAGAKAFQPFRDLAKLGGLDAPIADLVKPQTYPDMYPPDGPGDEDYHPLAVSKNLLINRVDRPTAETVMRYLEALDAPMRVAQIRVMGGAMARIPWDATAFAHRSFKVLVNVAAFYEDEADRVRKHAWMDAFAAAIQAASGATSDCAYVNFVGDEGEARIHDIYPDATLARLTEIKRRYDPTNVFRLNQNIPPA